MVQLRMYLDLLVQILSLSCRGGFREHDNFTCRNGAYLAVDSTIDSIAKHVRKKYDRRAVRMTRLGLL